MPIADNSPPIVVGIRQTIRATKTVIVITEPAPAFSTLKRLNGSKVIQTRRKTIDNIANKIESAISFGVFWRLALSTSPIILSRKLSPGSEVTFITTQSESTLVPPVNASRSPPDSRITGADSPVTALSSTDAMP